MLNNNVSIHMCAYTARMKIEMAIKDIRFTWMTKGLRHSKYSAYSMETDAFVPFQMFNNILKIFFLEKYVRYRYENMIWVYKVLDILKYLTHLRYSKHFVTVIQNSRSFKIWYLWSQAPRWMAAFFPHLPSIVYWMKLNFDFKPTEHREYHDTTIAMSNWALLFGWWTCKSEYVVSYRFLIGESNYIYRLAMYQASLVSPSGGSQQAFFGEVTKSGIQRWVFAILLILDATRKKCTITFSCLAVSNYAW